MKGIGLRAEIEIVVLVIVAAVVQPVAIVNLILRCTYIELL